MSALRCFTRLLARFRYPVTLPEDIASALGVDASNYDTFEEFIRKLTNPSCCPKTLAKYMPRQKAEQAFETAQRKEHFTQSSLFSYYFNEGWMEFKLDFDSNSLLRRVYIHHRKISIDRGIELNLDAENLPL